MAIYSQATPTPSKRPPGKLSEYEVDTVMVGYVGKLAISEGWWWELWQHLTYDAISTFVSNETMEKLKSAAANAWDEATMEAKIDEADSVFAPYFRKIWTEMKQRREDVRGKYSVI